MRLVTMDVHSDTCTAGIFHGKGGQMFQIKEQVIPTTIPDLKEFLSSVPGKPVLVIEEGPLASWLKRHLQHLVRKFIVTNPRRNALVYSDADKDDSQDPKNLATIYATKAYKEVYHTDDLTRQQFKDLVLHYHDHTKISASVKSKIKALFRAYGIRPQGDAILRCPDQWIKKLAQETDPSIARDLIALLDGNEFIRSRIIKQIRNYSYRYPVIERFQDIPGIGLIISCSFFTIIDTPWRFKSLPAVQKYCGLAVVNKSSNGKWLSRPGLNKDCNHILKSMMLTGAHNAVRGKNVLAEYYKYHCSRGISSTAAKNHTARKMVQIMMSMWKHDTFFDPEKVHICK
jgi:transposase